MRGREGGTGRPALTPPLPGQDGAGRDQLVQEEAEGGAGGAGGGGRGRALRDRRPQARGGRSVLQQPQRETHLLLRVEPAPQLERYGGKAEARGSAGMAGPWHRVPGGGIGTGAVGAVLILLPSLGRGTCLSPPGWENASASVSCSDSEPWGDCGSHVGLDWINACS